MAQTDYVYNGNLAVKIDYTWNISNKTFVLEDFYGYSRASAVHEDTYVTYTVYDSGGQRASYRDKVTVDFPVNTWSTKGSYWRHDSRNQTISVPNNGVYIVVAMEGSSARSWTLYLASHTDAIAHWCTGWKNGEGNNGDHTAYQLGTTTFSYNASKTFLLDSSRGITPPRGFSLNNRFGSGDITGSWAGYAMPYTAVQWDKSMWIEYYYSQNNYPIYYNLNGGTNNSNNPTSYTLPYGVNLQNPTKTGYTFKGWDITYHPDNIVAAATTNTYHWLHLHSAIVPGITYKVHIGKGNVTAGSATNFTVLIHDFTTGQSLASYTATFGEDINFEISCPSSADVSHRINLICYTGIAGSTANIGATWEDICVTAQNCNLINRGTNISFDSANALYSALSVDYRDIGNITCTAQWLQAETYIKEDYIPNSTTCKRANYIESTGAQYIDSGINPVTYNSHFIIEADFETTSEDSGWHSILGAAYGDNNGTWSWVSQFNFATNADNNFTCELPGGTGTAANVPSLVSNIKARRQRHYVEIITSGSGVTMSLDGALFYRADSGIKGGPNKNLYIFTRAFLHEGQYTAASYTTKMRLYRLKITARDSYTLLRDFIPCYNTSTGKAGLWDQVSKQFFGNIGTGNFNYQLANWVKGKVYIKNSSNQWIVGKSVYHKTNSITWAKGKELD